MVISIEPRWTIATRSGRTSAMASLGDVAPLSNIVLRAHRDEIRPRYAQSMLCCAAPAASGPSGFAERRGAPGLCPLHRLVVGASVEAVGSLQVRQLGR